MKRRLFKLVLFLLLGAIVNVAVAWECALWSQIAVHWNTSTTRWERLVPDSWPPPSSESSWRGFGVDIRQTVSWSPTPKEGKGSSGISGWFQVDIYRAGWPFRSMVGDERRGPAPLGGSEQSRIVSFGPQWSNRGLRSLPLHPIWPGFAINTIFYAAILWLLTFGPFTVRRMIRRKRGHCIKCGYDLGHADHRACPECGAAA